MNATLTPRTSSGHETHLHRAVEIALLVGAGLVIAAGMVLLSGVWSDFTLAVRVAIAAAGAVALAGAAAVVATRHPGIRALRQTDLHSEHEGRRMLTAVLLVGTAAMTAFTILQFPTAPDYAQSGYGEFVPQQPYWTPTIALAAALAVAAVAAWIAPGVVSTLAVFGFTLATLLTLPEHIVWTGDETMGPRSAMMMAIAFLTVGVLGSTIGQRLLRPAVLILALSLFAWFVGGLQAAVTSEQFDDTPYQVDQAVLDASSLTGTVGKISLAVLLVLGIVMFLARATWPWPTAAIASLVGLTLAMTTSTLGVAAALLITGALLIAMAGGMLLVWRARAGEPAVTGQSEESDLTA